MQWNLNLIVIYNAENIEKPKYTVYEIDGFSKVETRSVILHNSERSPLAS